MDSRERRKGGEHKPSGRLSIEKSTHPTLSSQSFPISKARHQKVPEYSKPRESAGAHQGRAGRTQTRGLFKSIKESFKVITGDMLVLLKAIIKGKNLNV